MKNNGKKKPRDFSFLQTMSTEDLREILVRDMDLEGDESDTELIWKAMETLTVREEENEEERSEESALTELWKRIGRREKLYAAVGAPERSKKAPARVTRLRPRFAGIAAAAVLVLLIGFAAAGRMGYALPGVPAAWKNEATAQKQDEAYEHDLAFSELDSTLKEEDILCPVIPKWLPTQYHCEDIRTSNDSDGVQISATASDGNMKLRIQVEKSKADQISLRFYEESGTFAKRIERNGIVYYVVRNDDSDQIVWSDENVQVSLEFTGSDPSAPELSEQDVSRIIGSLYGD